MVKHKVRKALREFFTLLNRKKGSLRYNGCLDFVYVASLNWSKLFNDTELLPGGTLLLNHLNPAIFIVLLNTEDIHTLT